MEIYLKMLDHGTLVIPVKDERNVTSIKIEWKESRVIVDGIMRDSISR